MELSISPADSFWTEHDREANLQSEPRRWWGYSSQSIVSHPDSHTAPCWPTSGGRQAGAVLAVARAQGAAGRRRARGRPRSVRSHVKEAGRWGQWGSAPGSEQENERPHFPPRWLPLTTERKKGRTRREVMVTLAEIGRKGWRAEDMLMQYQGRGTNQPRQLSTPGGLWGKGAGHGG